MRKIIPLVFIVTALLVGCKSTTMSTSSAGGTNSVAGGTNSMAAAAAPVPAGPNTPDQTMKENHLLGDLAGIFIVLLTVAAVKRC
jgi:hypothetical protein